MNITLFTNCCIYDTPAGHNESDTKSYYKPTGRKHLVNITARAALLLTEKGARVIVHLPEGVGNRVRELFSLHPNASAITFIEGDLASLSFVGELYSALREIARKQPVGQLSICLYDSFAAGRKKPFAPMIEESLEDVTRCAVTRLAVFTTLSDLSHDLLLNKGLLELRLVVPTALAARRASAHLFTDTVHKVLSTTALRTLAYELSHYTGKNAVIVELMPGIVDTGMYDDQEVIRTVQEEAALDGFPFAYPNETLPMLSPDEIAEVIVLYLSTSVGKKPKADSRLENLTTAGRSQMEVAQLLQKSFSQEGPSLWVEKLLPDYCYVPEATWGTFPPLRYGYIPIPLTPKGQLF